MRIAVLCTLGIAIVGCAAGERVPPEAQLMYYGPTNDMHLDFPQKTGMVYLTHGGRNSVIMAGPLGPSKMTYDNLKPGETIAVYFLPSPSTTGPAGTP